MPLDSGQEPPTCPGEAAPAPLHISLLGEFALREGTALVTSLQTPSHQALLAYLALHAGQRHARQHLAFTFWPDSAEGQARTNLRKALFHIRRALPGADRFLRVERQTVTWKEDGPYTLDVTKVP